MNTLTRCLLYHALMLLIWMIPALPAFADGQETQKVSPQSGYDMGEMVITATRFPVPVDKVAGKIEVITAKDIESLPFERVDDLLGYVTGVTADRTDHIFSLSPRVSLRGLGGNVPGRTLVLIDGQPASTGDTGNMRWNRINTADIQRIEIFKGPGSSVYGSNAMGGVINIITRRPDKNVEGSASVGYGTYNTRKGSARLAGRQAKDSGFYGQVAATGLKSDGFTSLTSSSSHYDNRIDRFVEEFTLNTKAGYQFSPGQSLELGFSYFDDARGEGYRYNLEDGSSRDFDTNSANLLYKLEKGDWQIRAGGFYQKEDYFYHRDFSDIDDVYTVSSDREDFGSAISLSRALGTAHSLTFGVDTRFSSVDAIDDYDTSDQFAANKGELDQYAVYVQDQYTAMSDRLILTAGLRFDQVRFHSGSYQSNSGAFSALSGDMDSNSWSAFSPKLAARYHVTPDFSLYTSYSRGFRAPILDALCRYGIFHGRFYDANPDLENETIDTFEIGADSSFVDNRLNLSISAFYSRGKDFIYSVDTGATRFLWGKNRSVYLMENASEVRITGLEADVDFTICPGVKLFAGYAFNDSVIDTFDKRPDLENKQLEYVPRHSGHAGLQWLNPVVNISAVLRHVGTQYSDDQNTEKLNAYKTVNLKFWRELACITPGLKATLTLQNLLDEEYLVSDDDKGPGRFIMAELSYQF
ncbi:MAG: TonB-dependent receptor [Desulfobacter sp.]|nr:MAG: TonB-dependent receptor [Desulfobacter sp.]